MPFVSPYARWYMPRAGHGEILVTKGHQFPYLPGHERTIELLYNYEGSFDANDRCFHPNVTPLWRFQTQDWDDSMWKWWMGIVRSNREKDHFHYKPEPYDVLPLHEVLDEKWCYPLWVLQELIELGCITQKNMIKFINEKIKEEAEKPKSKTKKKAEVKDEAPEDTRADESVEKMYKTLDPQGKLEKKVQSKTKKKVAAKV